MNAPHPPSRSGLTLIEFLVAVFVIGILTSYTLKLIRTVPEKAAHHKLLSDIRALNRAVDVYEAFYGSLDSATTPEQVLRRLKSTADQVSAEEIAGLTGSMIDPRLVPVMITPEESITTMPRAVWNLADRRFRIVTEGFSGVKKFDLDGDAASMSVETEVREASLKLSTKSGWIWDYAEDTGSSYSTQRNGDTREGDAPAPAPVSAPAARKLSPPTFSIPGGTYDITKYDLDIVLENPNPAATSRILYSINFHPWEVYDGEPIVVHPATQLRAYSQSAQSEWSNSAPRAHIYNTRSQDLEVPAIIVSAPNFDFEENRTVVVTIEDPNEDLVSDVEYRINNREWRRYTSSFEMSVFAYYLAGANIEARAVAAEDWYQDSGSMSAVVERPLPWFRISGESTGDFRSPAGAGSMRTDLAEEKSDSLLTWGAPRGDESDSSFQFNGAGFDEVEPGERFLVGTLDYHNGDIQPDSGAKATDLSVTLRFDGTVEREFDFGIELVNSPNETGTPEGDADFVQLAGVDSRRSTIIRGNEYRLILEFGETSEKGFSSPVRFHVLEDATATAKIYGRLELAQTDYLK